MTSQQLYSRIPSGHLLVVYRDTLWDLNCYTIDVRFGAGLLYYSGTYCSQLLHSRSTLGPPTAILSKYPWSLRSEKWQNSHKQNSVPMPIYCFPIKILLRILFFQQNFVFPAEFCFSSRILSEFWAKKQQIFFRIFKTSSNFLQNFQF